MTNKETIIWLEGMKEGVFPWSDEVMNEICDTAISALSENKGEWIKYSFPRCGEQHYQCTSCGYYINFGQWGELYTKEFKFCPNCGARMKGGE